MMQMKKTCIIKTLHLMMHVDDVDEKNMYYKKTLHLMMQMKKHVLKKQLT